jgi:uncharacterized membrane protein
MLHGLTMLVFAVHIACGFIGLISGTVALFVRKGGRLHRTSGNVFFVSMIVMAVTAGYLGAVIPRQQVNVIISVFALYLVVTGWMAVRRKQGAGGPERGALIVGLALFAPFAFLTVQLLTGLSPFMPVPTKGPIVIAISGFTFVLALCVIGDARIVFTSSVIGIERIARHLWRMCIGLVLAVGSGFTNGIARLLPGPYHVPLPFFFVQFIPVAVMLFWLVRIRFNKRVMGAVR